MLEFICLIPASLRSLFLLNSKQKTCPYWATFEELHKEISSPQLWPAFLLGLHTFCLVI